MCYEANRAEHKKRLQAQHENAACVSKLNSVYTYILLFLDNWDEKDSS